MINMFAVGLVLIVSVIGAFGSILLKKGSERISLSNRNLILGVLLHGIGAIIYIIALKMESLSILYPIASITYVWICLLSIRFLEEKMNVWKWSGILSIIVGISFIGLGS